MNRKYETLKKLRAGETVDLDGLLFIADENQELKPGDLYIAQRNTGPKLLTVREINENQLWVHPTTPDYPFDIGECVKVVEVE